MTLSRASEKWLMLSTVGPRYLHGLHRISRVILPFHAQMWYEIQLKWLPLRAAELCTLASHPGFGLHVTKIPRDSSVC